jgi:NADH-quinone oxidoreductase subunit E
MSVRRLAEIQPDSFAFTLENAAWTDKQIAKYPGGRQASAVLSLLWRAQKQNDYWLPKPAIEEVARKLDMPYIRVLEIATFYTMFNLAPVGRFFIQMCGTTPCVLRGSDAIKRVLETRIGAQRAVTADGNFSWLEVECLGACCNAPMVQINDDYYEDLTPDSFNALLDDLAAGRPVKVGPQNGRNTSEPEGGLTSLTTLYGRDGKSGPPGAGHEPTSGNGQSSPKSAQSRDEGTTVEPSPSEPAHARSSQEERESAGRPDTDEGTRTRTEPPASGGPHAPDGSTGDSAKDA